MDGAVGALREVRRVMGLVEDGLPHQHTGVVAVAADHLPDVVVNMFGEGRVVVPELPARRGHDHEHTKRVAGIHEGRILGIMRGADDGASGVAQQDGVAPGEVVGHRIADVGVVLVAVHAHQFPFVGLPVEEESFLAAEFDAADARAGLHAVNHRLAGEQRGPDAVQARGLRRPQRGILHLQALRHLAGRAGRQGHARDSLLHLPLTVQH